MHGHRVDYRPGAVQALPERLQSVGPLALAHEDDGAADQIPDHGGVALLFAQVDLVEGDLLEVGQPGTRQAALQVAFLDVLDDVSTDAQVRGHGLDGHVLRQLQGDLGPALAVVAPQQG